MTIFYTLNLTIICIVLISVYADIPNTKYYHFWQKHQVLNQFLKHRVNINQIGCDTKRNNCWFQRRTPSCSYRQAKYAEHLQVGILFYCNSGHTPRKLAIEECFKYRGLFCRNFGLLSSWRRLSCLSKLRLLAARNLILMICCLD